MFPEPTELLLIGYSIESIWTKNPNQIFGHQKPTRRHANQGTFTRDEWNHFLCLFGISHFSSTTECTEVTSKRTQKESGEERVTAKSRPMMNLIARSSERLPFHPLRHRNAQQNQI